jgi:glycosyltransferase involved in cell wall biosynthesis
VPFLSLNHEKEISQLHGTVVFVNRAYAVPTRNKAAIILHCVVPKPEKRAIHRAYIKDKIVIATSIYNAQKWALYLSIPYRRISVVVPFADPIFGNAQRSKPSKKTRILYAGRLHPEKGIYTLLEMMHDERMRNENYQVNIITAGQHVETGRMIASMLKGYTYAQLIPPQKAVRDMSHLLARSDVLLMPSVYAEPFGMLSIEAQHAGCRVVASNIGGLPETNCGLLTLVEPRNPQALLSGIDQAVALGPATKREREDAKASFMLNESVDSLLEALRL